MSTLSYLSLCAQYSLDDGCFGGEYWWTLTKGYWEFLKSVHDNTTSSSKLRGNQFIRRMIFEYLKPREIPTDYGYMQPCKAQYSFCKFVPCAYANCKFSECEEHGYGDHHNGEYTTHEYIECDKHYCWDHVNAEGISTCEVCSNGDAAQQSLGCYDRGGSHLLCPDHPAVRCTKLLRDSEDYYGDADSYEICGFYCCSSCLADHRCGDDPTEYCWNTCYE